MRCPPPPPARGAPLRSAPLPPPRGSGEGGGVGLIPPSPHPRFAEINPVAEPQQPRARRRGRGRPAGDGGWGEPGFCAPVRRRAPPPSRPSPPTFSQGSSRSSRLPPPGKAPGKRLRAGASEARPARAGPGAGPEHHRGRSRSRSIPGARWGRAGAHRSRPMSSRPFSSAPLSFLRSAKTWVK